MPILIFSGLSAVAGMWVGAKANASVQGTYVGAQEAAKEGVSNVMIVAGVIGIFLVGKSQKWW
ncbi:MAG: hypothetical protein KF769_05425 [Parvibaculum sp.]|nr:hypothetical protein [Parvibaculum sp.]